MKKFKDRSLSAKTAQSTVQSCIVFGIIVQIVALSFYFANLTTQYIKTADTTVKQVRMSLMNNSDLVSYSDSIMERYHSLDDEQLKKVGTYEYRRSFTDIDTTTTEGGTYDQLFEMLADALSFHTQNDISDIYLAMYDKETSALVYIVDPDIISKRFRTGEWEAVDMSEVDRFLAADSEDDMIYDMGMTKNYGLLCTVGSPVMSGDRISAFVLADISLNNILDGMGRFSLGLTITVTVVTIIIAIIQTRHIRSRLVEPINKISDASLRFASGGKYSRDKTSFFADLNIRTGDEIEHLAKTMSSMESDLYDFGENLLKVTKETERIGTELALAAKIQADMLPNKFPAFPDRRDFDIFASMTPAKEVGGDFYDFFLIDEDHLGIVMADVSGKGVPAALFMMMTKILISNYVKQEKSPAKALELTNNYVCENNREEMFVTVWLGVLEISTGKVTAANAGHEYPVIKTADGSFELLKDKHGFVIGGLAGMPYKEYEFTLDKGGVLFLYTDGVPEAKDAEDELFGTDRMLEALNSSESTKPAEVLERVEKAVAGYVQGGEPFDDLTMLALTLL